MRWSLAKALSHLIHDANTGTANRQLLPVTLSYFPHVLLSTLAWPISEEAPQGPLLGSLLISLTLPCSPQRTAKCPPPSSVLNPRSPQLQTRCPPGWFWPISQKKPVHQSRVFSQAHPLSSLSATEVYPAAHAKKIQTALSISIHTLLILPPKYVSNLSAALYF